MNKEYTKELEDLKLKMEQAEIFASKLPIFEKIILESKFTGDEDFLNFGERYKDIPLTWRINRGLYDSESRRNVTNYSKSSYKATLFSIYVNVYSLFNHHQSFDLNKVAEKVPLFFYDKLNSTFYATDEQIAELLEALNDWYLQARKENEVFLQNEKLDNAKKQVEQAQNKLKELTHSA